MPQPGDTPAEFGAGEILFREGDAGRYLYVIQSGAVRLTKQVAGRDVVLADLGGGDFAGEVGVVCDSHTATATALEPTRCLVVDPPTLEDMIAGDAEIGVRLVRGLASRLAACHRQLDLMGHPPASRVALAIAQRAAVEGQREDEGIFIARRLRDLGAELGVDEAELGEISKVFIRDKLIRIRRNGILVPDVHRMYEFVRAADANEAGS
jgi:CRP/FNR family transcriptional regulator, cyclic AMP receptor protein